MVPDTIWNVSANILSGATSSGSAKATPFTANASVMINAREQRGCEAMASGSNKCK
jgi:hypothetical protein